MDQPGRVKKLCTTPGKMAYPTQAKAREHAQIHATGLYLTPYRCRCKWWHLTTPRPRNGGGRRP